MAGIEKPGPEVITPRIERMPCRPLIAVFDERTNKLSVHNPARLYPEPDQAGIGIASECCRYEHRDLADLSIPSESSSQAGERILAADCLPGCSCYNYSDSVAFHVYDVIRPALRPSSTGGIAVPLSEIDRKLIDRCLGREPGAWNDFVDRYVGLIYHVIQHVAQARSRVVSQADMEDIAAEILLRIVDDDYEILRRYKAVSSLPTYLTVIARRTCVKEMVKRQREAELSHASAHRENVSDASGEVEAIATADEVDRILEELPEREAEVVRLYHLQFMNYREIGKRLGIPEASVGPILSKARKRLRNTAAHRTTM